MIKSINLIAPAFVTMSAAISAVKPNKITRMCLMLMPNDAATSPPNAKTIRCRIAGFDSATSLPRMLFANHSVPSCWQVFGLRWVVECGGCVVLFIAPHTHRETTLHDILYDTNPPPQPLAKTCVVLGVCQTPTRWVTYIRSPTQNPSTHACAPGVGGCLFFCCVRTQ